MAPPLQPAAHAGATPAEPRFCDVAVTMNLLTPPQVAQLLERQKYLKGIGLI